MCWKMANKKNTGNMPKASVVLMVDTEGEFSRLAFSSRTPLLYKIKMAISYWAGMDYSLKTLDKIVKILKKYNLPATFFFVGALYLRKQDKSPLKKYIETKSKTSYLFNIKKIIRIIPSWGDYIEKNMKNDLFELGIHNFLHESNFVEDDEQIRKSIKYTKKAANAIGIKPKSYAAPWFELETKESPKRIYDILKTENIDSTRFDGILDTRLNKIIKKNKISQIYKRYGINCINSSYFIANGKIDKKEYAVIEKGIQKAINNGAVYAISTHDTTFAREGTKHFENIIRTISKYRKDIQIRKISDLVKNGKPTTHKRSCTGL
ncbi:polysaccharide deacetylase family protein [Candidatus Woesearchaeota archaeon]|nr:polysaccharide deacetylase family protein [Candidatus Woesearchaeota archaeon]